MESRAESSSAKIGKSSRRRRQSFAAETSKFAEPGIKGGLVVLGILVGVAVLGIDLLIWAATK